jgi:hypothetical protein
MTDQFEQQLRALEDKANAALAAGEPTEIVSIRGRMARLRRAAEATDPQWDGVKRMLLLDRALVSAVTGIQLALRRERPVPIPEHVAKAAEPREQVDD